MRAMILDKAKSPFRLVNIPTPHPTSKQVLIEVHTCAICRTDMHIIDGELTHPKFPLILGHQVVGRVAQLGDGVNHFKVGDRVGVPWLGGTCGDCEFCRNSQENLCDHAIYTGYNINGGFADFCVANADYCFPIPETYSDINAAPLLCAGLIGYRSYRMTGNSKRIGFYGFGNAAHILIQLAIRQKKEIFVFTRHGDVEGQAQAIRCGATWAGNSESPPPVLLDSAIIFAPVGPLIPLALQAVKKGGIVVCAGIYMSTIPPFSYDLLYGEKILCSVTNLTRKDGEEFFALASQIPIKMSISKYPLEELNQAVKDTLSGTITGTGVIVIKSSD